MVHLKNRWLAWIRCGCGGRDVYTYSTAVKVHMKSNVMNSDLWEYAARYMFFCLKSYQDMNFFDFITYDITPSSYEFCF